MGVPYEKQENTCVLYIVIVIFLVLTYTAVSLRFYVRLTITKVFALDDWFMLLGQTVFTLSCAFLLRGMKYGIGRHNSVLSQEDEIGGLKYQALATLSYIANMVFIKLSIALFLLRIAVTKPYIWLLRLSMLIVSIWSLSIFIYDLFQCVPVAAQWNYTITNKRCVSGTSFVAAAYSISAMTIVSDWLYALIPIPMIWSVQMTRPAKITVGLILSLGIFASVATLIRLKYLLDLSHADDLLYTGTTAMVWTLVEPGVAIIAASLVTIRPLLRTFNFSGFESTEKTAVVRGELTLRSDIAPGWSNSTCRGGVGEMWGEELKKSRGVDVLERVERMIGKGGRTSREDELCVAVTRVSGSASPENGRSDAGSEECFVDEEIGIRRTVDVSVMSQRGSKNM